MNLPKPVVRQILRGDKTEHRIPATTRKPRVGDSLIIQNRREHNNPNLVLPQVRAHILAVTTQPVGDITTAGALAEGHKTLAEFASDWMRRHDTGWPPQTEALCKQCDGYAEYTNHHGETTPCGWCDQGIVMVDDKPPVELILDRFQRRHAHHLVHVLELAPDTDVIHYLNKRAYLPPTTNPTEALDPEAPLLGDPHPDWRERAERRRQDALRDRDGARLAGLDRLAVDLQAEAQRLAAEAPDVDVSGDLFVIEQRLDKLRSKVTRRAA